MEWWTWLLVALVVLLVAVGAVIAVQARRRRGGVIASTGEGRTQHGDDAGDAEGGPR